MTTAVQAGADQAPAAGRRVTPTGRLILPADADRAPRRGLAHSQGVPA